MATHAVPEKEQGGTEGSDVPEIGCYISTFPEPIIVPAEAVDGSARAWRSLRSAAPYLAVSVLASLALGIGLARRT
ncbi:hypothetical protein BW733_12525 [Tessaracoccus flavescens]|uniref:Uncharacterized protein n=1 Tax=Tessaracoccus flavescens TaxID=399497 RepID=A0A1Q2CZN6_9ACTN|nr:hypothetical protein BW733_12525 [Tessaracoccus flavescens]